MEEVFEKLGRFNFLGNIRHTENTTCEVTELWLDHSTNKVKSEPRRVVAAALADWLATVQTEKKGSKRTLIARFVWIGIELAQTGNEVSLSESVETTLANSFGIGTALSYSRSCVTGITALSTTSTPWTDRTTYSFSYTPKLAAIWSHSRSRPPHALETVTEGLFFGQKKQRDTLKAYFERATWCPEVSRLAMFPALMIAILLGNEINQQHQQFTRDIGGIESRTGVHNFASRENTKAAGDELNELSRHTNGLSTKLASTERKTKTLEKLLGFIIDQVGEYGVRQAGGSVQQNGNHGQLLGPTEQTGYQLIKHHAAILKSRVEFQIIDAAYISKRIQTQIEALANIITQRNSNSSLDLTEYTADIALYSYQDSSSMKTLAVVTMFFLPGSFVSALFSTQAFDWDKVSGNGIGLPQTPQFRLYWAITIPMTIITFVLYFLWLWFQHREQEKRFTQRRDEAKLKTEQDAPDEPEIKQLVNADNRRSTMRNLRHNS